MISGSNGIEGLGHVEAPGGEDLIAFAVARSTVNLKLG